MSDTSLVPTRWQGHRLVRADRPYRRLSRLLKIDIRPEDPDVVDLRKGLTRGDPLADAFVEWAAKDPRRAREHFDRVVERGLGAAPDAPEELVRWFAPLEREPAWLDHDAIRLARRVMHRGGAAAGTILTAMALMGGYRSSAAVKPLAMTGALDKMVVRRIAETSRFVLDVIESDGLGRFSPGFKSACRVRLMHAMVRRSLKRRADWDFDAWGMPINQTDMAATQLEFSAIYLSGLMVLGFRFTPEERDAVMHLWRYVGVIMGADDALLAHDYRAGVRQMLIHGLTNPHADDDSRALAKALHELPERLAEGPAQKLLARMLMRYRVCVSRMTLGDEAVDDIGLPPAPEHRLLWGLSAVRFGLETVRTHLPGATRLAEWRGLRLQRRVITELGGGQEVHYVPYADRKAKARMALRAEPASRPS